MDTLPEDHPAVVAFAYLDSHALTDFMDLPLEGLSPAVPGDFRFVSIHFLAQMLRGSHDSVARLTGWGDAEVVAHTAHCLDAIRTQPGFPAPAGEARACASADFAPARAWIDSIQVWIRHSARSGEDLDLLEGYLALAALTSAWLVFLTSVDTPGLD